MREMKDSGVEWIGEIPKKWQVKAIREVFKEINNKNTAGLVDNCLKFTYGSIVKKDNFNANEDDYVAKTILTYNIVDAGTIMLNGLNLNFDFITQRVALVKEQGVITSAYLAIKPIDEAILNPEFSTYLFKAYDFCKAFHNMGVGVRKSLSFRELKKYMVCFPDIDNQRYIVSYLDSKCSQIDTIIERQQAVIDKLKEYKLSLITEAVTKGLNPDVPMKDSGVEWIGDIPGHWKIMRFKSVVAEISSGISAVTSNESNYTGKFVLRTSAVSSGYFKPDEVKSVTEDAIDRLICPVEKGTVIMSRMNTAKMVGASAYIDRDYENFYLPDKLWKIKFTTKAIGKYCWYALNCVPVQSWFACVATGSSDSMQNIALKDFLDTFFVFPSVNEQNQIADFLDRKCTAIDATISKKQAIIEKLTAYKKSLIYEVVTGKKEV